MTSRRLGLAFTDGWLHWCQCLNANYVNDEGCVASSKACICAVESLIRSHC